MKCPHCEREFKAPQQSRAAKARWEKRPLERTIEPVGQVVPAYPRTVHHQGCTCLLCEGK